MRHVVQTGEHEPATKTHHLHKAVDMTQWHTMGVEWLPTWVVAYAPQQ